MNCGERARAIVESETVREGITEGMGVLVIVSSLSPAVGGGTAVVGWPRVTEAELLTMLERLVAEMKRSGVEGEASDPDAVH